MRTIRAKLFMIFSAFMIALIVLGVIFNALFLEDYYIYKNRDIMVDLGKQIELSYKLERQDTEKFINQIDRLEGVSCLITDAQWTVRLTSIPQRLTPDEMRLPSEIDQLLRTYENKLSKGEAVYTVIEKPLDQAAKLMLAKKMENGDLIILRKPIKGIQESVAIANQFYWLAGIILIFIGGLFLAVFSKALTKPLRDMSITANEIAHLNFEKRVMYTSSDELGYLGMSINQMSERLSESLEQLRQDVDRRKQLVRNVSHELKSPIGVIKGYAEGLTYSVVTDPMKTERYCKVIAEECDRMDGLVRQLLDLSMLESGQFTIISQRFNLSEVIKRFVGRYEDQLNHKQIALQIEVDQNLEMEADQELIERLLSNFLENAIHHIGGERVIRIHAFSENRQEIQLAVTNTGQEISEVELQKIWDVFYKVDKSRARVYGGHGIGLSIVKQIAELHGGTVGAENTPEGILFYAKMPIYHKS